MAKTRFFYHPESNCLFTTTDGSFPSDGLVEELDHDEYLGHLSNRIHAWEWQGRWYAILNQEPLVSCNSRTGILDWIHGYTGIYPTEDKIHDPSPAL